MAARSKNVALFDFLSPAFSVISGAISGVTPKLSGWIRVIGIESLQLNMYTTGTVAGAWTVQVATDFRGQDAIALDPRYIRNANGVITALPVPAGAATGPTVFAFFIPDGRYTHFQIVFTPTSGAGVADADMGIITSSPADIGKIADCVAVEFMSPSTSTIAGQPSVDYASTFFSPVNQNQDFKPQPVQADGTIDPPVYFPAIDSANAAITFAAFVSGANVVAKRFGGLEFASIRAKFAPASGFGRVRAFLNSKAMG